VWKGREYWYISTKRITSHPSKFEVTVWERQLWIDIQYIRWAKSWYTVYSFFVLYSSSLPSFTIPVKKKNNYCIPTFGPPCITNNCTIYFIFIRFLKLSYMFRCLDASSSSSSSSPPPSSPSGSSSHCAKVTSQSKCSQLAHAVKLKLIKISLWSQLIRSIVACSCYINCKLKWNMNTVQ